MDRRNFIKNLIVAAGAVVVFSATFAIKDVRAEETPRRRRKRRRRFVFKVKTHDGNIVGGIAIEAENMDAAKVKLRERYKNSEILDAKER